MRTLGFLNRFLSIPRLAKGFILVCTDTVFLIAALFISFSLRLVEWYWPPGGLENGVLWLILGTPIFAYFGLYRAIVRYLGLHAAWAVVRAVSLYALVWGFLTLLSAVPGVPRSVALINFLVALIGIGGSRFLARWTLGSLQLLVDRSIHSEKLSRVLIFGACEAGRQLAHGLRSSSEFHLHGFINDDPALQGRELMRVPILLLV